MLLDPLDGNTIMPDLIPQEWETLTYTNTEEDEFINIWANGMFQTEKKIWNVREMPCMLPTDLVWCSIDLADNKVLNEVSVLLNENPLDFEGPMYQNQYNTDFIKWAMQSPEILRDWNMGIRSVKDGELLGFVSATPRLARFFESFKKIVEINLFRIHKSLRAMNITGLIISEVIRRFQYANIFRAICSSDNVRAEPIYSCNTYLCPLNTDKLIEVCMVLHFSSTLFT